MLGISECRFLVFFVPRTLLDLRGEFFDFFAGFTASVQSAKGEDWTSIGEIERLRDGTRGITGIWKLRVWLVVKLMFDGVEASV